MKSDERTTVVTQNRTPHPGEPPTRPGVPLKDRPVGDHAGAPPQSDQPTRRRRHCYVTRPDHEELEGLVLQWAQDQRGWVALVTYVVPREGGDVTMQEWLPADQLRPA